MAPVEAVHNDKGDNVSLSNEIATTGAKLNEPLSYGEATLLGLPVELLEKVLKNITANADKKNLCLTCKAMQTVTTPLLYKHMAVEIRRLHPEMRNTISTSHPGLPHVRTLSIEYFRQRPDSWDRLDNVQTSTICRLLNVIPKDKLTRFQLSEYLVADVEIHFILRLRQSQLTNFQCYGNGLWEAVNLDWEMLRPQPDELAHITTLQLYLDDSVHSPVMGRWIYARTPALCNLDLKVDYQEGRSDTTCCDHGRSVVKKIFDQDFSTWQTPRLKSLRINGMCLSYAGNLLPKLLGLMELEHLQIIKCGDTGSFFRSLQALRLNLSSLYVVDATDSWRHDNGIVIDDFLLSLQSLKRVTLSPSLFREKTLDKHKLTLESLHVLDDGYDTTRIPDFDHAPELEQLAVTGFRFEYNCWQIGWGEDRRSSSNFPHLDALRPLTSLRVLKVVVDMQSLLQPIENISNNILRTPSVLQVLEPAAEEIFALRLPDLHAVVFAIARTQFWQSGEEIENCIAFLGSKDSGATGEEKFKAKEVEPQMVKHHVPGTDILDPERFVFM